MKRTALEKLQAMKTVGAMKREPTSDRYGASEKDKAAGLVPFAVKLPQDLVAEVQSLARKKEATLNDITAELLRKALKAKK